MMKSRQTRSRKSFQVESLEIRNAPSHFGVIGHAAIALHHVHAPAHVRHFSDPKSTDRSSAQENTTADTSRDNGVETTSNDASSKDPNSVDPRGNP